MLLLQGIEALGDPLAASILRVVLLLSDEEALLAVCLRFGLLLALLELFHLRLNLLARLQQRLLVCAASATGGTRLLVSERIERCAGGAKRRERTLHIVGAEPALNLVAVPLELLDLLLQVLLVLVLLVATRGGVDLPG